MGAAEKRERHPNPNVRVIEAARDYFPKDHYMYCALDHAAAELAVLHERCQRAALSPPDGFALVPVERGAMYVCPTCHGVGSVTQQVHDQMLAARPEVKND